MRGGGRLLSDTELTQPRQFVPRKQKQRVDLSSRREKKKREEIVVFSRVYLFSLNRLFITTTKENKQLLCRWQSAAQPHRQERLSAFPACLFRADKTVFFCFFFTVWVCKLSPLRKWSTSPPQHLCWRHADRRACPSSAFLPSRGSDCGSRLLGLELRIIYRTIHNVQQQEAFRVKQCRINRPGV